MSLWTDIASIAADATQFLVRMEAKTLLAKSMERQIKQVCFWGGLFIAGLLVLLAGIGLIIAGAYILLASATGAGVAALIIGVIVTLLAAVLTVTFKYCIR
jgi:hypothetical protein